MTLKTTAAALSIAGTMMLASPAMAQDATDYDGSAQALVLVPLQLTKIADLDFGTVIRGTTDGTVVISAFGSARAAGGGVTLHPGDEGNRAEFATAATPGQQVDFTLTYPVGGVLSDGNGNDVTLQALFLDGPSSRTADPVLGVIFVNVGGIVEVPANQVDGEYTGTFTLTAEYN
ncbi:DUF4402 domain-containing protein [Sphingomicrobium clamense]|uniref:DUF4402 domain-containing protein n=1 Tax=Sphingomicrobium clamense TaxID=2851013 RepID=A0ABS6V392_9SPHN|nr:DUF4402 domain-containing protein [Sphingomicrobium sp. B8]MBW0144009.1 DUF4402 domain-containing protein [Sphingomicrobium sp. B8]